MGDPNKGRCHDSLWQSSVVSENSRERGSKRSLVFSTTVIQVDGGVQRGMSST
jgi:hypothetical protein